MKQNTEFNFTQEKATQPPDQDFKMQRQAYLAQRNARKRQAELLLKRDRGNSTSSDEGPITPKKKAQPVQFQEKTNQVSTSPKTTLVSTKAPEEDPFKVERQRYKAQRAARKKQANRVKKQAFGPSSSDSEEDSIPIMKAPQIKISQVYSNESIIRRSSKQEFDSNPFVALDLSRQQKEKQQSPTLSARLRMKNAEKKPVRQRFQIELPSKKGVNVWLQKFLEFKPQSVEIGERSIPIYDITKVKLHFTRTASGNCKMKVTYKQEDIVFAVDHKKLNELCLDHYYYFFAKIVCLKLQIMGKNFTPCENYDKNKLGLSEQQLKGAQITGKVRKSSFFGGWEETAGVINQLGLCIYKAGKQKPSMIVSYNSLRELWTRFQFDDGNLIIKFLHNSSKVELSIPCENYLSRDNWLYHIYNLASK